MSRDRTGFAPVAFPQIRKATDSEQWEAARRRGHSLGYAEGMQQAAVEALAAEAEAAARRAEQSRIQAEAASRALDALAVAQGALNAQAASLAHAAEDRIIALATELAESIIGAELSDRVQAAINAAARAAREAVSRTDAVVTLNPGDLATLDGMGELPENVVFESAVDILPGDSAVKLPDGEVDLRVSSAIERVRATVAKELA